MPIKPDHAARAGPVTLTADGSGAFSGELAAPRAGAWDVVVTPTATEPITRRVTVGPGDGPARPRLRLDGGDSYLELEEDGAPVAGVSGAHRGDGERVELSADETLRIRAGNAGAVRLTINGIGIRRHGRRRRRRRVAHHANRRRDRERDMAADSSFDVVSDFDQQELVNALDQARREIATRYDFKGSKVAFELGKEAITLTADDEYRAGVGEGPARDRRRCGAA